MIIEESHQGHWQHQLSVLGVFGALAAVSVVSAMAMFGGPKELVFRAATRWFGGGLATLLRKETLVLAGAGRLPVHTLTFRAPGGRRCLGLRTALGDVLKVVVPGHKPKSYSVSAEHKDEDGQFSFDVTFKVYPDGRASGFLDRLQPGDSAMVFHQEKYERAQPAGAITHVGLVALGVGITEALPIATAELERSKDTHVLLLWTSRTPADTFWHARLSELRRCHGARFRLVRMYSRWEQEQAKLAVQEDGMWQPLHGRVDSQVLARVFDEAWGPTFDRSGARFVSVGTKEMMKGVDQMLCEIGYDMPAHALLQSRNKLAMFFQRPRL